MDGSLGHEVVEDEFDRTHLASQLYEVTEKLRGRADRDGGALVLDTGASDGLFLARFGVARGVGLNLLPICAGKSKQMGIPHAWEILKPFHLAIGVLIM